MLAQNPIRQKTKTLIAGLAILALALTVGEARQAKAQYIRVLNDRIKTVTTAVGEGRSGSLPVLRMGTDDRLNITFDELSHDYHRYTYRLQHLNADFTINDRLLQNDFVAMTDDEGLIDEGEQSMNTTVAYTTYRLTLPNDYMRPLLSGNYRLTVYEDADDGGEAVVTLDFMMAEDKASLMATATTNTDIDTRDAHQQLDVNASWRDLNLRDPAEEMKLVVLKNDRFDAAVCNPKPTAVRPDALMWEHQRDLIFKAGNEYRKIEIPSTRYPGMHLESVKFFDPYYHADVRLDEPRKNYLYDEDQNGRMVVGCESGPTSEPDYLWVHFSLATDRFDDGRSVFVNGRWTNGDCREDFQMDYDPAEGVYRKAVLLKQGYYSYQYLVGNQGQAGETAPIEGDFYQTENEYTLLLYYCAKGSRYDRLVGYRTASFRP